MQESVRKRFTQFPRIKRKKEWEKKVLGSSLTIAPSCPASLANGVYLVIAIDRPLASLLLAWQNFTDNVTTRLALALAHRPSCISWPTWLATGRYLLPMAGLGFQCKNQNLMWCFGRRKNYSSFMCNWRYTLLAFISKFSNKILFNQWNLTLNFGLDMVLILIQQYLFACGGI